MWDRPTRAAGFELVPVDDDEQTSPHRQRVPAATSRWAVRRLLERRLMTVEAALERVGQLRQPGAAG